MVIGTYLIDHLIHFIKTNTNREELIQEGVAIPETTEIGAMAQHKNNLVFLILSLKNI